MSLSGRNLALSGRLAGVSVALEPGRITAICGPNGAGKSTLLSALAGLLTPDSGSAELDGRSFAALDPRERAQRIGYLPQEPEIAWDVAVRHLVALGRLPHRDRGEAPIRVAMDALDITRFADRPASRLSGGERARVLLARVLATEPEWILADEPLAALDLAHQLALLGHLRRSAEEGTGVVLVLHDLALARNHADRVVVLDDGAIAAEGAASTALSEDVLQRVWGVSARWVGEAGAQALAVHTAAG